MVEHLRNAPTDTTNEGRVVAAFRVLTLSEQNLIVMYILTGYNCAELARRMKANRCVMWQSIHRIKTKLQKHYEHNI